MKTILANMFVNSLGVFLILAQCVTEVSSTDVTAASQPLDHVLQNGGYFEFGINGEVKRQDTGSLADLGAALPSDSCTYIAGHFTGIDVIILIAWVPAGCRTDDRRSYVDKVNTVQSALRISAAIVADDQSDLAQDAVKREVQLMVLRNARRRGNPNKQKRIARWW